MKKDLKKYIFQTGHGKGLAKTEILAVIAGDKNPEAIIVDEVEDGFVIQTSLPEPVAFLNRLGGIVRIMEVLQSGPSRMPLNFEQWVTDALRDEFQGYKGKMRFGLSMHPKNEGVLKKTLNSAKKNVKDVGNVRYVNKDFQNLSSVQAWHEHLLDPGAVELHLFQSETTWYLTKTLAIQDFEWYSKRDIDRPAKSAKNGMFPPKLAQILINLVQAEKGTTIFDPFCGSGTVLQEAWLLGHPSLGSDFSPQMVADTKVNLEWLAKTAMAWHKATNLPIPTAFEKDATVLTAKDLPKGPFAIVTETTLGPILLAPLPPDKLAAVHRELEALYEAFFKNLKAILPAPITMIFTAPYHRQGNLRLFLENLPAILARHAKIIPLSDHARPSLFYERKDQLVSREIWKLEI